MTDPAPRARVRRRYDPAQRLAVVGTDPFALAIAGLGQRIGWDTVLLAPFAPEGAAETSPLSEGAGAASKKTSGRKSGRVSSVTRKL